MKKIIVAAACCLWLCCLGTYLSGCAKEIGTDGFVRIRQESLDADTGNINPALYQRKEALGADKPTYVLKLDGHYHLLKTQIETD